MIGIGFAYTFDHHETRRPNMHQRHRYTDSGKERRERERRTRRWFGFPRTWRHAMFSHRNGAAPHTNGQTLQPSREIWTIMLADAEEPMREGAENPDSNNGTLTPARLRTLLQHTYTRALRHSSPRQVLPILSKFSQRCADTHLLRIPKRNFVIRPQGCESGPAISLAISRIMEEAPQSSVLLLPLGHRLPQEEVLDLHLRRVLDSLEEISGMSAVLFGIRPEEPQEDIEWILPGCSVGQREQIPAFFRVQRLVERPEQDLARRLFEHGALKNTLILAGKARRLWHMLWKLLPETSAWISRYQREMMRGTSSRRPELVFERVVPFNFFRQIIEREPEELLVTPLECPAGNGASTLSVRHDNLSIKNTIPQRQHKKPPTLTSKHPPRAATRKRPAKKIVTTG